MRMPCWIREAMEGYRWLWGAQLRWRGGSRPVAAVEFVLRLIEDVALGALTAVEAAWTGRSRALPATVTPEGRVTMAVPRLGLAHAGPHSANDRLKAGFDSWLWTSMILAVVIHFATFALWPELTAAEIGSPDEPFEGVILPPELDLPEPPKPLDSPALPVMSSIELEYATIPPTTFDKNPVAELPPPPLSVRTDRARADEITPFTVAPRVLNTDEVVRAMQREYPSVLRNSGIGGSVGVLFRIDEEGRVIEATLDRGSGYSSLDAAALAVAGVIRFSPAMNRDERVAVRVVFPIVFRVID